MEIKRKIFVICGPTATGKTDLAIKLAKKYNGEIVSADSRQVYRGMDIGTGKDFQIFKTNNVKVWLYDIVKPDDQFSVADYVKCADLVIEDIWQKEKLPIIVGGTGLYIKGLIDGIGTLGVPPDWELRTELSNYSVVQLADKLKKLNPEKWQSMNYSDRNNSRRLIRAIEIAREMEKSSVILGRSETTTPESNKNGFWISQNDDNLLMVGLTANYKTLYQRIDQRVEERIKNGVEKEIKKLTSKGYTLENSVLGKTIGYQDWPDLQKWKFAEHAYARRQMTWFKKEKRINWFNIEEKDWQKAVEEKLAKWYNN